MTSAILAAAGFGAFGLVLLWVMGMANRVVALDRQCDASWSGIDVQLRRRYDLIPNLVQTVQAHAAHEVAALEGLVQARNRAQEGKGSQAELESAVRSVYAVAEGYPTLRSAESYLRLQEELRDTEDRIAAARRFHNANVRDFNVAIETFPGSLFAGGRSPKPFFED